MGSIVDLSVLLSMDSRPFKKGLEEVAGKDAAKGAEKIQSGLDRAITVGGAVGGAARGEGIGGAVAGVTGATSTILGLIPGAAAVGGIIGTVGGLIAEVFGKIDERAQRMREAVKGAFGAMLEGSQNARQALVSIRTEALVEGFRELAPLIDAASRAGGLLDAQVERGAERTVRASEERAAALERAQQTPTARAAVSRTATLRAVGEMGTAAETARNTAAAEEYRATLLAQGLAAGQAAAATGILARAQQLSTQASIPLAEAFQRLAFQLPNLILAQQAEVAGRASAAAGEMVRAGGEEILQLQLRSRYLVTARGITADMSAEEAHLAELRRQGADPAVIGAAEAQIGRVRAAREQAEAAGQGRALREQMRSPLEAFQEEQARLEDLRHRNVISQETFNRGLEAAALRMESAAGIPPPGQQAFMEGTAATVSAINRARRDQAREDRGAAMAAAIQTLAQAQREAAQRQRDLLDFFRQPGGPFQAANI